MGTTNQRRLKRAQARQEAKLKTKTILEDVGSLKGELLSFGAFYKDEDDDGFSCFFAKYQQPDSTWEAATKIISGLEATYKQEYEELYNSWEEQDLPGSTWEDYRQDYNDDILDRLRSYIKDWNVMAFGSETRPAKGDHRQISMGKDELVLSFEIIVLIYILEQEGVIVSDNFNGMLYNYTAGPDSIFGAIGYL